MAIGAVVGAAVVGAYASNKASKRAAKAQDKASNLAASTTKNATTAARMDINRIFPQAQDASQRGFQSAAEVFGKTAPAQAQAFQGGNVAAQQQILAGLPQIQNALMGNQVDYSQLQPYVAEQPNFDFMTPARLNFAQQEQEKLDAVDPFKKRNQFEHVNTFNSLAPNWNTNNQTPANYLSGAIGGIGGNANWFNQHR